MNEITSTKEIIMNANLISPDDFVSDISVEIGLELRGLLDDRFPGRLNPRKRDSPLCTAPGHTIFVAAGTTVHDAHRIIDTLVREVRRQLAEAQLDERSTNWTVDYMWDGHGLFQDGALVRDGFRFDASVEVTREIRRPL